MYIDYIEVQNFRNLVDGRIPFGDGIQWLVGSNGQGKTNCLEAVYFSLTTKSFRVHRLSHLIRESKNPARIHNQLKKGTQTWPIAVEIKPGQCLRMIGNEAVKPLDLFKIASVIAFTARSKLLVEGQPEDRRRFLDRMIAHLDLNYIATIGQYKKVHAQLKKALLKNQDLYVYQGFKKYAAPIAKRMVERRMKFIAEITEEAQEIYATVFEGQGQLSLDYKVRQASTSTAYEQKFLDVSAQELLHQRRLMGPHLDELDIRILKNKARHFASSGQVRAIVLSVKLAVREAYMKQFGKYPLLLLDDIDAELDSSRIQRLLDYLEGRGSTLITTSKYGTIGGRPQDGFHEVVAGRVTS